MLNKSKHLNKTRVPINKNCLEANQNEKTNYIDVDGDGCVNDEFCQRC